MLSRIPRNWDEDAFEQLRSFPIESYSHTTVYFYRDKYSDEYPQLESFRANYRKVNAERIGNWAGLR